MKVHLMFPDADFDVEAALPAQAADLTRDLGLDPLVATMAGGDELLSQVARVALLSSLVDPDTISYRQDVLADCVRHPDLARRLYTLAGEAVQAERSVRYGFLRNSPTTLLHRSVGVLSRLVDLLRELRRVADEPPADLQSAGLTTLFGMLRHELDASYFAAVADHLERLQFRRGLLVSARLGRGLRADRYVLRVPARAKRSWTDWWPFGVADSLTVTIPDRDEAGARALGDLRDQGLNQVANALAQSADHVLGFFLALRREAGFYVACLNLVDELGRRGRAVCRPQPLPAGQPAVLCGRGLYDVGLALRERGPVVGNDVCAEGCGLIVVTGANQGGKSTFLRSVGLAQLMLQAGMFTPADALRATVARGVFSHYRREEDISMTSGKLEEELSRMREVVDRVVPGSLVLSNESFAATNEREGSRLAGDVIRALVDCGVRVVAVTHLFDLARELCANPPASAVFLRAERRADGTRTFRLAAGEPLPTSYGPDLYERIFTRRDDRASRGAADGRTEPPGRS